jgi:predicted RNase H-like HicB family nuclease
MLHIKIIIEKHEDGFVAYPLGLKGGIAGEGDSYEGALADAKSAIGFHIETFGPSVFEDEASVLEAYIDDFALAV